jgi:cell division protease FtsH
MSRGVPGAGVRRRRAARETLGPRVFDRDHSQPFLGPLHATVRGYSDGIAREIDDEIRRLVDAAHERAERILLEHRDALTTMAEILLDRETLSREQFESLLYREHERAAFGRAATPAQAARRARWGTGEGQLVA